MNISLHEDALRTALEALEEHQASDPGDHKHIIIVALEPGTNKVQAQGGVSVTNEPE